MSAFVTDVAPRDAAVGAWASWTVANQSLLAHEFTRLKALLRRESLPSEQPLEWPAEMPASAVDRIQNIFELTSFERDLLLLCAGLELDSELAQVCASASAEPAGAAVSFSLALAYLPAPHWSALTPGRPLRRLRLLELAPGEGLTTAPLRIDERVLHELAGVYHGAPCSVACDPRLRRLLAPVPNPAPLPPSHARLLGEACERLSTSHGPVHLFGDDPEGRLDLAAHLAGTFGYALLVLRAEALPPPGPELELIGDLLAREAALLPAALLLSLGEEQLSPSVHFLLDALGAPEGSFAPVLLLGSRHALALPGNALRLEVNKPPAPEQELLWSCALAAQEGGAEMAAGLGQHFRLSARTVAQLAASNLPGDLWAACRAHARPRVDSLAQRMEPGAAWSDLVLPVPQLEALHQLAADVRSRGLVHGVWGFGTHGARGLGVTALFTGESGTGKTLAAEILAAELAVDLYRVDLSSVVSKYIGETEKHLRALFDAAEESGAVLLFDEADALFGKRSEVKDAHDRYANIEVSYLLQRMESYRGLALLTTNFKGSLDRAFQRRLRAIVHFPFPDAAQRMEIWRRAFPAATPTEALNPERLAQLHVSGGHIRNIALGAACLAAQAGKPVSMRHLLLAARSESEKLERPLGEAEIRGWV